MKKTYTQNESTERQIFIIGGNKITALVPEAFIAWFLLVAHVKGASKEKANHSHLQAMNLPHYKSGKTAVI